MCVLVWTEAELIRGSPLINAARGLQPRVTWSQHPLWLSTWNFVRYWNSCPHPLLHSPSHIRFMLLKETPTSSTFLKDFPYRKIVNTTCEQRGSEWGSRGHVSVISFMKSIKRGRKGRLVEAGGRMYAVGSGRERQNKGLHQESQHHLPYPHTHTHTHPLDRIMMVSMLEADQGSCWNPCLLCQVMRWSLTLFQKPHFKKLKTDIWHFPSETPRGHLY